MWRERFSEVLFSIGMICLFGYFIFPREEYVLSTAEHIGRAAGVVCGIGVGMFLWLLEHQGKKQPQPTNKSRWGIGVMLMTAFTLQAIARLLFGEIGVQTLTQFFVMTCFIMSCFITLLLLMKWAQNK